MKTLMTTKNARFEDPSEEAISETACGILWNNSNYTSIGRVLSPFGWTLTGDSMVRQQSLRDTKGEVRPVEWGKYMEAIEYASWEKYDSFRMKKEIQKLKDELGRAHENIQQFLLETESFKDEINSLRGTLMCIFDVNEEAGRGSRKRVRELILEQGIVSCEDCGKASCLCRDYDS